MSNWNVVPCLLIMRTEWNLVSPFRDKGADGTIGDTSHLLKGTSDHLPDEDTPALRKKDSDYVNEVHALDIDSTGPWPDGKRGDIKGSWFDRKIHELIAEEKRRWLDPKDMCRLHYIIWRGMIYSTSTDWEGRVYTGSSDPHFDHAHFSARYETRAESDVRSWGIYNPPTPPQEELPVDPKVFNTLMDGWASSPNGKKLLGEAVLAAAGWSEGYPARSISKHANDEQVMRNFLFGSPDAKGQQIPADAPVAKMVQAAEVILKSNSTA